MLSQELYRLVFDNANDLILLMDTEGKIIGVNRAVCRAFNSSEEDFLGKSVATFVHRSQHGVLKKRISTLLEKRKLLDESVVYRVEAGGESRYLEARSAPIIREGGVEGIISIMRDVTARVRYEKELENVKEELENLLNSAKDGIFIVDKEGRIIETNRTAAERLGYSVEELRGMTVYDITPEDVYHQIRPRIEKLMEGECIIFESWNVRKDGGLLPVEVSAQRITYYGEEVFLNVSRDISRRKQMEEAMIQAEKLSSLSMLAAGLAHELNNLLNNISLSAQLLREDIEGGLRPRLADVDDIILQVDKASSVINDLLEFSKLEVYDRRMVNLKELVDDTLKLASHFLKGHSVRVSNSLSAIEIKCDPSQLQQVFFNILLNGAQAMEEGGEFIISGFMEDGGAGVSFRDNGPGIPKENLDKVFNPFFTTKEPGEGTGLGLALALSIVKRHNGNILVESERGWGTKFTVILPHVE